MQTLFHESSNTTVKELPNPESLFESVFWDTYYEVIVRNVEILKAIYDSYLLL